MKDNTHAQTLELSRKYGCNNEVADLLLETFDYDVCENILNMNSAEILPTVRVNFLKATKAFAIKLLAQEGIIVEKTDNNPECLIVKENVEKIGHSIAYLTGVICKQGLGSQITVDILDPQPGEKILDLTAAPGNKSSFIGERMKNCGTIVCNDVSHKRITAIQANLDRHGIENAIITNYDGTIFPMEEKFDRVLIDAPCTGEGLIVSVPYRRKSRGRLDSYILQRKQQLLVSRAIQSLKPGGTLVYSTCSLNKIENEHVLTPFLDLVKFLKINSKLDKPAFRMEEIPNAIRLIPSVHLCDGFFIAKGRKL